MLGSLRHPNLSSTNYMYTKNKYSIKERYEKNTNINVDKPRAEDKNFIFGEKSISTIRL